MSGYHFLNDNDQRIFIEAANEPSLLSLFAMKQFSLVILFCVLAVAGFAQVHSANDAFSKYQSGDYLSAIKLYQSMIAHKATLYGQFMLAMCYEKADSAVQAKLAYEKVACNTTNNNPFDEDSKVGACGTLTRIYLHEKNYRQALNYYRLLASIFDKARFDDVNRARFHFFNANDQAKCDTALEMPDSAITILTPYMFYSYKVLHQMMVEVPHDVKDSLQHDSISRFYLALLQRKYTNKQIKAEFQKAEENFTFTEDRRPADNNDFLWEYLKCSIDIYGAHVVVVDTGLGNTAERFFKDIQIPFYTKAYQLEQFRQLLICRLVRALPG